PGRQRATGPPRGRAVGHRSTGSARSSLWARELEASCRGRRWLQASRVGKASEGADGRMAAIRGCSSTVADCTEKSTRGRRECPPSRQQILQDRARRGRGHRRTSAKAPANYLSFIVEPSSVPSRSTIWYGACIEAPQIYVF